MLGNVNIVTKYSLYFLFVIFPIRLKPYSWLSFDGASIWRFSSPTLLSFLHPHFVHRIDRQESNIFTSWVYQVLSNIAAFHPSSLIKKVQGKILKEKTKVNVWSVRVITLFPCPRINDPRNIVQFPMNSTDQANIVIKIFRTLRRCRSARDDSESVFLNFSIVSL